MTKLDEAVRNMYATFEWNGSLNDRATVLEAARSYAALLKLAPEIGKLVEAGRHIGETAHNLTIREDYDVPPHKALALFGTDGDLLAIFEGDYMGSDMDDAEFFIAAANSRPTIKAIYDNLTAFGKDTSHD